MKKTPVISILFLLLATLSWAQQDSSYRLVKTISGDIVDFAVDNLDNLYLLSNTDQLKKINADGDSVAVYNDVKKFGKLSSIDVSNPMKVLLYYRDFNTVVLLDRLLNVRTSIDLRKHNIFEVAAICQSYDGKIWIFDAVENKLKKIDEEGKLLTETADFRLLFDEAPVPQSLFDRDGYVYLYDTARGIYVFDYFGALKNRIPITGWSNLMIAGKYIFGVRDNKLNRYHITTFAMQEQSLLSQPFRSFRLLSFTANRLYAFKNEGIEIYSLQ